MMNKKKIPTANQVDNQRRVMFLGMFLLSLVFAIKVASYLVGEEYDQYLKFFGNGVFILFAIVFLGAMLWKVILIPKDQRHLLTSPDSFVMQSMNKACMISWAMTLVLLSLLTVTTDHDSSPYPTEFYLNLTMFFMLVVFSISFFFLFRSPDDQGDSFETPSS